MAFAGTEHNLTSLINTNFVARNHCFRSSLKSPDSLPFWFFSCVQFCSTRTALTVKTFLQNFHRPLCHQSKFSLGGFPRSVGFSFLRFQTEEWVRTRARWLTATGFAAVARDVNAKEKPALRHEWPCTARRFATCTRLMQWPFPCSSPEPGAAGLVKAGKKQVVKPITLLQQSWSWFVPLRLHFLPSSPVATSRLVSWAYCCWHSVSTEHTWGVCCAAPGIPGYTQTYTCIRK